MICISKSMWFSQTKGCIILLRLEVCTKVAAFECKNKMGSSHKLRSLANAFRIFRLSPAFHAKSKSCPRPIPQQDSSMLLQRRSFVWIYIYIYIMLCWGRCELPREIHFTSFLANFLHFYAFLMNFHFFHLFELLGPSVRSSLVPLRGEGMPLGSSKCRSKAAAARSTMASPP